MEILKHVRLSYEPWVKTTFMLRAVQDGHVKQEEFNAPIKVDSLPLGCVQPAKYVYLPLFCHACLFYTLLPRG